MHTEVMKKIVQRDEMLPLLKRHEGRVLLREAAPPKTSRNSRACPFGVYGVSAEKVT
ncbi:hypothetical protein [Sorangium sp. So ce1151]|uniref:hypothetical protein n=1 Tax=Sorangium sp. So ce1151 TaxID=3133332 RepID=UPI003F5EF1AF